MYLFTDSIIVDFGCGGVWFNPMLMQHLLESNFCELSSLVKNAMHWLWIVGKLGVFKHQATVGCLLSGNPDHFTIIGDCVNNSQAMF